MTSTTYASYGGAGEVGAVDERVLTRHQQLASLPDVRLQDEALKALRYELDLPADLHRRHVIERLRAWLLLEGDQASKVARAFADATALLEESERDLVRETEEDAVMDGLSYREFQRLAAFMPSLKKWRGTPLAEAFPARRGIAGSLAAALALAGNGWEI